MAYGRFNPLDDTNTYPFMNGRNPGAYGNSYKTFAQLLEDINAKGFNTAIVRPSKSGDGNLAYYTIIGFDIPDSDIFRIGNDEYFTGSYYPNGIYFENFGDVHVPNVGGYYYANGSLVDTGVSYTLYTRCSAIQSKDNVSYHGVAGEDNSCLDLGCVIVSNANVGTWYFNNQPLNPPTNESGGAGSGYIGNSLLSNKKMVGYNVPTSEVESTKTESISEYSDNPVSDKPKGGNGFAKIKLLREYPTPPSNYIVDIRAEYGAFNLVTQNPLDTSRLTGVAVQNDYFYREDLVGSTVESGFLASFGGKFNITGKLIFETEVLIGDEDKNATANPDWVMGLYSDFSYSTRIIEMVYRNHNFQGQSYGDYFYYYSNTPLGYPLAPLDDADYYNTFTKIKFEMTLNNGVITGLKCYRDNTLYRDDSLNIDISSITMPYVKMSIPSAANKQPVTQKIKYFKVYTET